MDDWKEELRTNSILKFVIVGGCSTGIDFVIYMLISLKMPITVSKGMSMICSSVFSYILNKRVTFENKQRTNICCLVRFCLVFLANLCVNMAVNYLLCAAMGKKLSAFAMATACGMTINYLGQRFFVFGKRS